MKIPLFLRNDDSDIVDEIEEFIDELLESHERFTLGGSSKYRLQYFGMSSLAESLVYADQLVPWF